MKSIVVEREVRCRADRCSLWAPVTNTERLNRVTGGERLQVRPNSDSSAARFVSTTNLGGFSVEYEERPYEWTYPESLRVFRVFRGGPVNTLIFGFHFTPTNDGGTSVKIFLEMTPNMSLMRPILQFRAGQTLGQMAREVERIDASIMSGKSTALMPQSGTIYQDSLERFAKELSKRVEPILVNHLVEYIKTSADYEASRIRPYVLADQWKLPRRDVLSACLHAVKSGMLELRWEVVCPSCRVATNTLPSLHDLAEHGTCQTCDLAFTLNLDDAIEASFAPSPAVRKVDAGPYCIGSPSRLPHVLSQALLPPKATAKLRAPDDDGRARLFVRGGNSVSLNVDPQGPAFLALDAVTIDSGSQYMIQRGGVIELTNPTEQETHAKVERLEFVSQAASARDVTALPIFRREFSTDLLRPGMSLKVSRVTLLFTDLTGSTQLYSSIGDAAAFKLVQDHFDVVIKLLEDRGGTLVKTMGDAVMAAFNQEEEALLAGLAVLEAFESFRTSDEHRSKTHIKVGMYCGPCYVITANGALDYFGQTVNIAARMQAQAESGEFVVEDRLAQQAIEAGLIGQKMIKETYSAKLKGVAEAVKVVRLIYAGD